MLLINILQALANFKFCQVHPNPTCFSLQTPIGYFCVCCHLHEAKSTITKSRSSTIERYRSREYKGSFASFLSTTPTSQTSFVVLRPPLLLVRSPKQLKWPPHSHVLHPAFFSLLLFNNLVSSIPSKATSGLTARLRNQ